MTDTTQATEQDTTTTRRDLALDGLTVALLVVGLLLPWDTSRLGFADTSVRVVTFLAALGVLVPHAVRWDGLPLPWPAVTLVKVLLTLPLAVLVTGRAALLSGLVDHSAPPRLAVLGFAALLSAVTVAVQPRTGEGSPLTRRGWRAVALALGVAAVLAEPVARAATLLGSPGADSAGWAFVVAALLVPGAVLAVLLVGTARRDAGLAHCAVLLGLTALVLVWLAGLDLADSSAPGPETLPAALTTAICVLAVAAVIAARPERTRLLTGPAPLTTGRAGLLLLLVGALTQLVAIALLAAVDVLAGPLGTAVELVLRLLLVLALVGALVLLRQPSTGRRRVAATVAVLPGLSWTALLAYVLVQSEPMDGAGYTFAPLQLALSLGLGVLTAVALTRPAD